LTLYLACAGLLGALLLATLPSAAKTPMTESIAGIVSVTLPSLETSP
jgi:hypothetical protein